MCACACVLHCVHLFARNTLENPRGGDSGDRRKVRDRPQCPPGRGPLLCVHVWCTVFSKCVCVFFRRAKMPNVLPLRMHQRAPPKDPGLVPESPGRSIPAPGSSRLPDLGATGHPLGCSHCQPNRPTILCAGRDTAAWSPRPSSGHPHLWRSPG